MTKEQLLLDLYHAYLDARRHKRGKEYQLKFEYRLEENLIALRDEIWERRYVPLPSTCFVIHDPKMREVFAAHFRDRIVHHLFYNYTHRMFERTFITDSYSCVPGRGTHRGIERLQHHIRSVSQGHSRPCYVLKLDIRGYFMHIRRDTLLAICRTTLGKMRSKPEWRMLDFELIDWLLDIIVGVNPVDSCRRLGALSDWDGLPADKSLFCSPAGCGLPIGNLSSQLFSNVYLNELDQYVKRNLGCKHYGRYVDDAYIVGGDKAELRALIGPIGDFLNEKLGLELSDNKVVILDTRRGVEFLGAFVKPHRRYVSNRCLRRMRRKWHVMRLGATAYRRAAVNSQLGVLSHFDSYRLRRVLFGHSSGLADCGDFDSLFLRYR